MKSEVSKVKQENIANDLFVIIFATLTFVVIAPLVVLKFIWRFSAPVLFKFAKASGAGLIGIFKS